MYSERPKTRIEWQLGNRCNFGCTYCHEMFRKGDKSFPDDQIVIDTCSDAVMHYDDLGRDVVFEFIGGEPTLLETLPVISSRLHNYPVSLVLRTNGSADLEWWKSVRRHLGAVVLSIHQEFYDPAHTDALIAFLTNPTDYPLDLKVLIPATHRNSSWNWAISTLKSLRQKYNLGEIQLLYSNFGRGSNAFMPYTEQQWAEYHVLGGHQQKPQDVSMIQRLPLKFHGQVCFAGIDTLAIDSSGFVWRGWCGNDGALGNIYNSDVQWPKETTVCKQQHCGNGFDQTAKKISG